GNPLVSQPRATRKPRRHAPHLLRPPTRAGNVQERTMKAQRRRGGWFRRILLWTVVASMLAGGIAAFVVYRELTADLPPVDQLARYRPPVTTRIFAEDGTLIGEFYVERRYLVPLEHVPEHVRRAFLAASAADFSRPRGTD